MRFVMLLWILKVSEDIWKKLVLNFMKASIALGGILLDFFFRLLFQISSAKNVLCSGELPTMPTIRHKEGNFSGAGAVLFLNELGSDVSIIVECEGSKVRFPVHSLFLIAMSNVLNTMLEVDLQEKSSRQIIIKDSNPTAIKQFLRFLYDGSVDTVDWHETLDVLFLAHKYEVTLLVSLCEHHLISCVSFNNVCILHEMAMVYSLSSLRSECRKLIVDAGFLVVKTRSFADMSHSSLEYFFSHRCLNVESESFILESLRQWSAAECCRKCKEVTPENLLEIMKPLLKCINFSLVSSEKKSFLPESVIESHGTSRMRRVNFYVPLSLQKHMTSVKFVVELGSFASKVISSEPPLLLKFSINESAYLVGFRLVGMFRTNLDFGITNPLLVLCREESKNVSFSFNLNSIPWRCGSVVGDYIWKEAVAYFPQPAKIKINCMYCMLLKNSNNLASRWPKTRPECKEFSTALGKMHFFILGTCLGVTELFLLPAPSDREVFSPDLQSAKT